MKGRLKHPLYTEEEIKQMLRVAGCRDIKIYGGAKQKFDPDKSLFILAVARKG